MLTHSLAPANVLLASYNLRPRQTVRPSGDPVRAPLGEVTLRGVPGSAEMPAMRAHIPDLPDATEGTMASFTFPPESSPGVPEAWREVEAYKTEEGTFRERMPAGTYVFKLGRPRQAPGPIEGMRVVLVDPPTFTAPVRVVGGQHTVYDWTPGGFVVASTQPLLSDATRPTLASPPVPSVAPAGIPWRYLAVGSVVFVVGVGGAVLGYRALTMPVAR